MSPMRLIILLVAAGAAIGAVFLVRSIQTPSAAVAAGTPAAVAAAAAAPAVEVLVARADIPVGKFVTADDLKWQAWPEKSETKAFFVRESAPEALESMVGSVARVNVAQGEPVVANRLVKPGQAGFMAAMLTPGTRAVSVEIAPETAAGGFILPDDRVDVLVTREIEMSQEGGGGMQNVRSDLILSNVRVLAIDETYSRPLPADSEGAEAEVSQGQSLVGSRATLELAERDAALLAAADKAGDISLSLRSITELQEESGATGVGRVYRDGLPTEATGVRVYRYGKETSAKAPAG